MQVLQCTVLRRACPALLRKLVLAAPIMSKGAPCGVQRWVDYSLLGQVLLLQDLQRRDGHGGRQRVAPKGAVG